MNAVIGFGRFWYDFIIGDDWRIAAAVVVALIVIGVLAAHTHIAVWPLLPLAVILTLGTSLRRAATER
jgi:hypothetical protein